MLKLPLAITLVTNMAIMAILAIPSIAIGVIDMAIIYIQLKGTYTFFDITLLLCFQVKTDQEKKYKEIEEDSVNVFPQLYDTIIQITFHN